MHPDYAQEATYELKDYATDWEQDPLLKDQPSVLFMIDQFTGGLGEYMKHVVLTPTERIAYALGYKACADRVHEQVTEWGVHEDETLGALCESTGLISAAVARTATN